jgi:hypothetical protein
MHLFEEQLDWGKSKKIDKTPKIKKSQDSLMQL